MLTIGKRTDVLQGLSRAGRARKEQEDAAYLTSDDSSKKFKGLAAPAATRVPGMHFAGVPWEEWSKNISEYGGEEVDFVICARIDLDHPLYYADNQFASCVDCDCDLQHRPAVPKKPKMCLCCAARRVRKEK